MSKVYTFILICVLLIASAAQAQKKAKGYSQPGKLGKIVVGNDSQPPTITLTKATGLMTRGANLRAIKIVQATKEAITLRGIILDDRAVASLKINGQSVPLRGTSTRKTFAVKLNSPKVTKTKTLEFVALDNSGNSARQTYRITRPSATSPPLLASIQDENPVQEVVQTPTTGTDDTDTPPHPLGKYWALVIGVSDYPHSSLNELTYPVYDANEVANVLTQNYTFAPEKIIRLINPTRTELIGALSTYTSEGETPLGENDNLLIFYAGHGYWDENYREGYWLLSDAQQANRANWVSNSDIQRACRAIQAKHILLLSDACFSGSMFATRRPFSTSIEEAYKERSRRAITAGNLTEVPDRSVFKEYLVKFLQENRKTYLDAGTLYNEMKEPITNNSPTRQRPIYGVIQLTGDEGGEFIFVRRK